MAVNPNPAEFPGNGFPVVGDKGLRTAQEPSTGKPINRLGGESAQSDVDIGTADEPVNIGTGGSKFESGTRDTGGAQELSGTVISDQSNTFNIKVEWQDDDGNSLREEAPSSLQGVTDVTEFNLIVKSDHFNLIVEDASGNATNEVHGSANAH